LKNEGAQLAVVAPKIGVAKGKGGETIAAGRALSAAPSILFDAVIVAPSVEGATLLAREAAAIDWLRDAFGDLKVIGHVAAAAPLLGKAEIEPDSGLVRLNGPPSIAAFIAAAGVACGIESQGFAGLVEPRGRAHVGIA